MANNKLVQKILEDYKGMKVFRRHTNLKTEIFKLKNNSKNISADSEVNLKICIDVFMELYQTKVECGVPENDRQRIITNTILEENIPASKKR